jgi:predicted RNase H-like nuclease (RuvC/YqgF family)
MWFRYPSGWSSINVEQQDFYVDHKDRDGNQYFVAPESLADKILVIPGFAVVGRPADAPQNVQDVTPTSKSDPLAQLSSQVETLRLENAALKEGSAELTKEREELRRQVEALTGTIERDFKQGEADRKSIEDAEKRKTQLETEAKARAEAQDKEKAEEEAKAKSEASSPTATSGAGTKK